MGLSNTSNNNAAAAGEYGSIFSNSTARVVAPSGKYFFSITFLEATTFDSVGGLIATDDKKYMNTEAAANGGPGGGIQVVVGDSFPAGITIFGQWTEFDLASGSVVAHLGS